MNIASTILLVIIDRMQKVIAKTDRMIEVEINSFAWLVSTASGRACKMVEFVIWLNLIELLLPLACRLLTVVFILGSTLI